MMLELALRSSAILLAAWALTRGMPRAAAATRHLVWHTALLLTLAAPFISPFVPAVPLASVAQQETIAERSLVNPAARVRQASETLGLGPHVDANALSLTTLASIGTAVAGVWFLFGWISAVRLVRRARGAPADWQLEANALCQRLGIAREVRVAIIDEHTSPLAAGLWRATILLPRTAAAWTAERRQAVLLHELAHVSRDDCRVQLVAQAACALYWFNPLVWIAAAQLRSERERACDDVVLRFGAQASSYASHLLDIARGLRSTVRPSAALAMARPSELEGRLLAVLSTTRPRLSRRWSRWAVAAILTCTTVIALGATTRPTAPLAPAAGALDETGKRFIAGWDTMLSGESERSQRQAAEQTLERADDPQEREHAVLALAFSSGRDVIPALLEALRDEDSQVREKAAIGLALRRDARVVEPLIAALSDPDGQVREKAAIALGTSGDPRAAEPLTRALQDPDPQVREKAAAGLVLHRLTP